MSEARYPRLKAVQTVRDWRRWWHDFASLATLYEFKLYPDKGVYFEYFEDGDTPEDALKTELARSAERKSQ